MSPRNLFMRTREFLIRVSVGILILGTTLFLLNHTTFLPASIKNLVDDAISSLTTILPPTINDILYVLAAGIYIKYNAMNAASPKIALYPNSKIGEYVSSFSQLMTGMTMIVPIVVRGWPDCVSLWQGDSGGEQVVCAQNCLRQIAKLQGVEILAALSWGGWNWEAGLVEKGMNNMGVKTRADGLGEKNEEEV